MTNAITRWEPNTGLSLLNTVNQLLEESFGWPFAGTVRNNAAQYLPIDIYETDDAFVVKAFVPGVTADQLDITTQQNTITIRAEQPVEQQEGVRYYLHERRGGTWFRSFDLPVQIDPNGIDAKLQNGVLTLRLPKAPEAKPHRVQVKNA